MNTAHGLLQSQYGSQRQQTESVSCAGLALILDSVGIFDGAAKHLETAADTNQRSAVFTEPSKLLGKTSAVEPFQILKRLLAAGQHKQICGDHFLGIFEKGEGDGRFQTQSI